MNHETLLAHLIEINSYSGKEEQLRSYIENWFADQSIESFKQGPNLLIHLEGHDRSRAFFFNSHMDTVGAEPSQWKYGPWTPTIEEGKMYGLGAADMKAGLASSMQVTARLARQGVPETDIWAAYVAKEETDGSGSSELAQWLQDQGYYQQYKSTAAIFTEPTGLREIEHGSRGNIFLQVKTYGDAGHSSIPSDLKTHSVLQMMEFSNRLQQEMQKWRQEFGTTVFEPPTVGQLTSIQAGVGINIDNEGQGTVRVQSPNKFPSVCIATFDIRTVPGFHEVAMSRIEELAQELGAEVEPAFEPSPSGYTDPSSVIVQVAKENLNHPELSVSQGATDMGFFSAHGIEAIVLGPGEKPQMHQPNEFCEVNQLPQAVDIYGAIVNGWSAETRR